MCWVFRINVKRVKDTTGFLLQIKNTDPEHIFLSCLNLFFKFRVVLWEFSILAVPCEYLQNKRSLIQHFSPSASVYKLCEFGFAGFSSVHHSHGKTLILPLGYLSWFFFHFLNKLGCFSTLLPNAIRLCQWYGHSNVITSFPLTMYLNIPLQHWGPIKAD